MGVLKSKAMVVSGGGTKPRVDAATDAERGTLPTPSPAVSDGSSSCVCDMYRTFVFTEKSPIILRTSVIGRALHVVHNLTIYLTQFYMALDITSSS